jgi:hypothetical protein
MKLSRLDLYVQRCAKCGCRLLLKQGVVAWRPAGKLDLHWFCGLMHLFEFARREGEPGAEVRANES